MPLQGARQVTAQGRPSVLVHKDSGFLTYHSTYQGISFLE